MRRRESEIRRSIDAIVKATGRIKSKDRLRAALDF